MQKLQHATHHHVVFWSRNANGVVITSPAAMLVIDHAIILQPVFTRTGIYIDQKCRGDFTSHLTSIEVSVALEILIAILFALIGFNVTDYPKIDERVWVICS
jgi:hypothetical protein